MKATSIKTKVFSEAAIATLDASIATFVAGLVEGQFVSIHYAVAVGPIYSALLVYTSS